MFHICAPLSSLPGYLRLCCFATKPIGGKRREEPRSPAMSSGTFCLRQNAQRVAWGPKALLLGKRRKEPRSPAMFTALTKSLASAQSRDFSAPHSKTITQNPKPYPSPESRRCPELNHDPNPSPNPNEQLKFVHQFAAH